MEDHEHKERSGVWFEIAFTATVGLFLLLNVTGLFKTVAGLNTAMFITLIGGHKILFEALRGVLKREISADLAVAIAAIAALCIKEYTAAAEVIFIMLIGEALESFAVDRTRGAIEKLLSLAPDEARVKRGDEQVVVPIDEVRRGDIVIVRSGERIPVDGEVVAGRSSVDQSSMTGESMPVLRESGDAVLTGTMNGPGALEVRAEAIGEDTKLAEIIHLVEEAEDNKAPTERRVDRYAKFFVPTVMTIAVITFFVNTWLGQEFAKALTRAVSVLIVACPCALVLATPTAVVAALGRLARSGILVKGGIHLETAGAADCVVFDKTGTLTRGEPRLAEVITFGDASEEQVLSSAASAEQRSEHVLGELIVAQAAQRELTVANASDFTPVTGVGVEATVEGERVDVGGRRILAEREIALSDEDSAELDAFEEKGFTLIVVAREGRLIGAIGAEDTIRDEAANAVSVLRESGVSIIAILTGDNERAADRMARQAGINDVAAGLLPADKVERIRRWQSEGRTVAMLGDGVNDAPSLAVADLGVAMGGVGSDIAMEAADVVIMTDDTSRLAEMIAISRRMLSTIKANIIWFAFLFNGLGVVLASTGVVSPVGAAVLHQISSLLVCLNSLRLLVAGKFHETRLGRAITRVRTLFSDDIPSATQWAWRHRGGVTPAALALLVTLHMLSGFYAPAPGEVGVERRFGKVSQVAEPGLRYSLPWPMGRVDRVDPGQLQTLEIGFRTMTESASVDEVAAVEPAAYEWDTRHTMGRYDKNIEEAMMLTGDENLVDATLVVQYTIDDPVAYLVTARDIDALMLACAQRAVRSVVSERSLFDVLAGDRAIIEKEALNRLQAALDGYECGVRVKGVHLQDIHPPMEVVEAFRDVSSAIEDRHRLVNEAEAYAARTVESSKGDASEWREQAMAYRAQKTADATGAAGKFELVATAYSQAPEVASTRLFLESAEASLAGVRKVIVDPKRKGRHELFLFDGQDVSSIISDIVQQLPSPTFDPAPETFQE